MSGLSWKSSPCKDFFLKYITIIFQSFNCFLFLHICCFRINIHRCFNICMTHNTLNHFQISFIFTKSGAKCVSDMMTRKMRNQYRASALPFCLNNFFGIVGFVNSFDCTVDYAGFMDNSVFIAKDNPLIPSTTCTLKPVSFCASYSSLNACSTACIIGIVRIPASVFGEEI